MEFLRFDVESSSNCEYDYLSINGEKICGLIENTTREYNCILGNGAPYIPFLALLCIRTQQIIEKIIKNKQPSQKLNKPAIHHVLIGVDEKPRKPIGDFIILRKLSLKFLRYKSHPLVLSTWQSVTCILLLANISFVLLSYIPYLILLSYKSHMCTLAFHDHQLPWLALHWLFAYHLIFYNQPTWFLHTSYLLHCISKIE